MSTWVGALRFVVALLAVAIAAHATPWFTQDPRTLPEGTWRVEEHVLYADIDEGVANGSGTPLPGGATEASALTLHTRIRYGARDDVTVFLDFPYVSKRVHGPGGQVRENSDLGDILGLMKWKYAEDRKAGRRRALSVFYKTHTGEYKGFPGLLATGSGHDSLGLVHLWEWSGKDTLWYASVGYVWTDKRNDTRRNPGDQLLFNLAAEHKPRVGAWNLVAEMNGFYEGHAKQDEARVGPSGATVISLAPAVQYRSKPRGKTTAVWEAGVQVPVITWGDLPAVPDYTAYAGGYVMF